MRIVYFTLVGLLSAQRLFELWLSNRNLAWAQARGAIEAGSSHFPAMKLLHTSFLIGCVAEVLFLDRPFRPAVGYTMLVALLIAQIVRIWSMRTLGHRWNARVVVVPGMARVRTGPYRWLRHPNYLAVVLEGIALPLFYGAWITATLFAVANTVLLFVRIRCEEAALSEHCS